MTNPAAEIDSNSRFRFAPSPTGTLHVGGGRTALFNWLLARNCGGKFILRIEDTDRERSTEASVRVILDGLKWLGLDWDEGPIFQSQRIDRHRAAVTDLIARGRAYPCFCAEDRLEAVREKAKAEGRPYVYDGACRGIDPAEARRRVEAGETHTIRFKIDTAKETTDFTDLIGGPRSFENKLLGDFVIVRSDGAPVYQLAVVVDDHDMGVTHVIRGDDHLSNTPRQILIFEALGWNVPRYGHLPLILGTDKTRLSKRHGATSILEFEKQGILPEAMFNYLALLGWSLDAETELLSREELVQHFSIDRFGSSPAVFDAVKLRWMNGQYLMRRIPFPRVVELAREYFRATGLPDDKLRDPWFGSLVQLEIERSRAFDEMRENLDYFFRDRLESYEEKGVKKAFEPEGSEALLEKLAAELGKIEPFDAATLEPALRASAESWGVGFGKLVHPMRLALTGRTNSPGIFDVLVGLGREGSISRLRQAAEWIAKNLRGGAAAPAAGTEGRA